MRIAAPWLVLVLACTHGPLDPTEGGMPPDAGRPCGLAGQIELRAAAEGTCAAAPIVVLSIGQDGTVESASAHVPVGVTVPLIPCTSHAPADAASCSWMLDVVCDGPNREHLAMTGTIAGHGPTWSGSAVTITMTGGPPSRLMCASTSVVATP